MLGINNVFNKCAVKLTSFGLKYNAQGINSDCGDTFCKSSSPGKKFKKTVHVFNTPSEYPEISRAVTKKTDALNEKRAQKFGYTPLVYRDVDKAEYDACNSVQYEDINSVNDKMRKQLPLNEEEQRIYEKLLNSMRETDEPKTVYRLVYPYDGFEEEVNSGKVELKGFSSALRCYSANFFEFWGGVLPQKRADGKCEIVEPVILKINLKPQTKILELNYNYQGEKNEYSPDEVVLPPMQCKVDNIDNDLQVIELSN